MKKLESLEQITTGNALLVQEWEYDFFLDAVSYYNKVNGTLIAVEFVKKNTDIGSMLFKIHNISMLSDILEIGKLMRVFQNHSTKKG